MLLSITADNQFECFTDQLLRQDVRPGQHGYEEVNKLSSNNDDEWCFKRKWCLVDKNSILLWLRMA